MVDIARTLQQASIDSTRLLQMNHVLLQLHPKWNGDVESGCANDWILVHVNLATAIQTEVDRVK